MSYDPFRNYDTWLTNAPEGLSGKQMMRCSMCSEHVYGDIEDLEGESHCEGEDEDGRPTIGVLEYDESWVWDVSDSPLFPY